MVRGTLRASLSIILMTQRINYSTILRAPAELSIWITTDLVIASVKATNRNERLSMKFTSVTPCTVSELYRDNNELFLLVNGFHIKHRL